MFGYFVQVQVYFYFILGYEVLGKKKKLKNKVYLFIFWDANWDKTNLTVAIKSCLKNSEKRVI